MKYLKLLLFLPLVLMMLSCTDGKDGETTTIYVDSTSDTSEDTTTDVDTSANNYVLLSGVKEKGPCAKGSVVKAWPLYDNFSQIGAHFEGETKTDLGYWEVPAQISEEMTESKSEGPCYSELDGSTGIQKLGSIFFTASDDKNMNPLTTIAVDVIRWVSANQIIKDKYKAIIDAEKLVAGVFGFLDEVGDNIMDPFGSISLNDGDLDAAKLAVASAAILKARSNQTDFMVEIAQAIKNEDTTAIELELSDTIRSLKLLYISNNLKSKHEELEETWIYPPMHIAANFPDYYDDLLTRTPVVTGTFNLDDSRMCMPDHRPAGLGNQLLTERYAIPHTFDATNDIESSRYIALNLTGYISIWTSEMHVNGHLAPGTKILDISELKEIILDDPVKMSYNGFLGDSHGLVSGTKYYIVITRDEDFYLSKGCSGGDGSFTLQSIDGGANWYGNGLDKEYYNNSGVKIVLTD